MIGQYCLKVLASLKYFKYSNDYSGDCTFARLGSEINPLKDFEEVEQYREEMAPYLTGEVNPVQQGGRAGVERMSAG